MTTINNSHLIEKVGGIERAREIFEGAPDWANGYNTVIQQYVRGVWFSRDFRLNDLRTAISEHDSREYKVGDLVVFVSEKMDFLDDDKVHAISMITENNLLRVCGLYVGFDAVKHATPSEIKAGHRLETERHG